MIKHFFRYMLLGVAGCGLLPLWAQEPSVEPRIAGLEGNSLYMSLLREDARLQIKEDSLSHVVQGVRMQLRENPSQQRELSQQILQLEGAIFDVRNAKGRLINRINTIEQEWVLANLNAPSQTPAHPEQSPSSKIPDSLKVRNLIYNPYFKEQLPEVDYTALRRAQEMEHHAMEYINRYFANHASLGEIAAAYEGAQTESEALELFARFGELEWQNRRLSDSISQVWNYIFDNKSYAYAYLLDKMGDERLLNMGEEHLAKVAGTLSKLQGKTASDAVVDYFLRKEVVLGQEKHLAEMLLLSEAKDSLAGVLAQVAEVNYQLPPVEIAERLFLDYDSVAFSATPIYTYQNPIPECKVYAKGTIYRVLLGTFNTKRAAAVFRGTYPLFYLINDEGKWCYYTGGFATRAEAEEAQVRLKKHGFVRPEVVVWRDGVYRNLAQEPEEIPALSYRIEIRGAEALSEEVKQLISSQAEGRELSRVGQRLFVVASFGEAAVAEQLASALRQADATLEIKVVEIVQNPE